MNSFRVARSPALVASAAAGLVAAAYWLDAAASAPAALEPGARVRCEWDIEGGDPWTVAFDIRDEGGRLVSVGVRRGTETAVCAPWDLRPAGGPFGLR